MSVLLTPQVAKEIAEIVRKHYGAMAATLYGKEAVAPEDWEQAVKLGLVDPEGTKEGIAEGLHLFGAMLAHLDQAKRQSRYGTTLDEFKAEIAKNPIPQTRTEKHAAEYAKKNAAEYVTGVGARAASAAVRAVRKVDARADKDLRKTIRDVVAARFGDEDAAQRVKDKGVSQGLTPDFFEDHFRSTINRQVSDIGHLTGDWKRDLQRVVITEGTQAVHEGLTESWAEQAKEQGKTGDDVLVFRVPRDDACNACKRLYLDGGTPRVFNLATLAGNGTNIGLKRPAWQPVTGPTHPFCTCPIHRVPAILDMPSGWSHGDAAPSVIGAGGQLVL